MSLDVITNLKNIGRQSGNVLVDRGNSFTLRGNMASIALEVQKILEQYEYSKKVSSIGKQLSGTWTQKDPSLHIFHTSNHVTIYCFRGLKA
ncbi:MAG: hypothetical protein ACD_16C00251G0003 [uncultured bacterium]|nr:MAG: hypothetical protein ACD_16C00251G0003 [uncultured bacterium]OGN56249.1 MAG: hypothetical protein A2796_04910 [Chlamydiae bacterium RIFCSPHIGHO2_01_FULL_44_39]OGN60721.1 MAG: hypothetical protein A3D96_02220 [Chlamydiae bacterium RIFCSPHIGHO2_12_FULL_44_59]OGN66981.1 MAG: hypothetical protein A2978_02450 [Chlamydiae bacterium RIFCSPLOWO2_01_FULL_44_52]OGN67533.1 MAG: hypothetical protein A3I67_03665 [Chlamydiae bacterium RIFCSPLOWO2_02_FULL_45_22]OGN71235.1 MAG: hypothetical protein A3